MLLRTLGTGGLLCLLVGLLLLSDQEWFGSDASRIVPSTRPGYFQAGRWRADVRTLMAAAQWFFDLDVPAGAASTNGSVSQILAYTNSAVIPAA